MAIHRFARVSVLMMLFVSVMLNVYAVENPLVEGLNQPRGIAYDTDGNLYIADPGIGGDVEYGEATDFGGAATAGTTSQLIMVAPDGTQSVVLPHLPSSGMEGEGGGLTRMQVTDDTLWLLFGEGAPFHPMADSVVALDRETLRIKHFIDLMAYETAFNPDGTEEVYSNAHDFFVTGSGLVYIVDTGANTLYTWDEQSGLAVFQTWSDNPVPTSVDVASDGSLYVGFLGTHIAPGAGRVDHIATDGTLIASYAGLTAVTDVMIAVDGTVYAVQLISEFGEQGPNVESGSILRLEADNTTTVVMDGLYTPYALAQAPDGSIVVSTNTAFSAPNSGMIVPVTSQ